MKITDLVSKYLLMEKEVYSPLLLEWQRPKRTWNDIYLESKKATYKRLKKENHEYFKAVALCVNYTESKVSLRKKIGIFPVLKRGTRGFILEDRAIELFNVKTQEAFREIKEEHESKLVLFDGCVFSVPLAYLRFV